MTIQTIKTDAFSMDYFHFGRGEKPLVILPGLSVQSVMNAAQAVADAYRLLSDDFSIYVFDRRKELPPVYSIREMAADTLQAMERLQLGPVCLFGASQGGMIAMEIAVRHPESVSRMILGSTSPRPTQAQGKLFEHWIRLAKAGRAEELYLSFGKALYPPPVFEQFRELLISSAKTVTGEELERFIILAKPVICFDILEELKKIRCPVLAIGSRDDQVFGPDGSAQIIEHLPDTSEHQLFMYDGYGHAAYDLAPDYRERMLRFLVP